MDIALALLIARLGVVHSDFHWHEHDRDDKFFYLVDGRFVIDLEARTVERAPRQGLGAEGRAASDPSPGTRPSSS
jgi:uncharacterized cupin superfamily protein